MTQPSNQPNSDYLRSLMSTARRHPGLWFIPLASAILIAVLMSYLGPKTWDATQSFVVREELIGRIVGPGRFESLDSMKTAQEVIQETARRSSVLTQVFKAIGEPNPSPSDIEALQQAISFHAAGGAELGKTEILTMRVKSKSAKRATKLVAVLFEQTRAEIRNVRTQKARSMMQEIGESVSLSKERTSETAEKIRKIEAGVGGDLAELRGLIEPYSSGSDMRRSIADIQREIRDARRSEQEASQLIDYLNGLDPDQLLATPRELLDSQPALSELKTRLIEAQVAQSNSGGIYSDAHPRYRAKANSVVDIGEQLNMELTSALVGLKSQRQLAQQRIDGLSARSADYEQRIAKLAAMRVDYGQLVTELELRNEELRSVHKEYSQAEAMVRASEKVDLISQLDEAQAGIRPLGPSRKTILIGATLAGLLIGLGLVMMVTPSPVLMSPTQRQQFQQSQLATAAVGGGQPLAAAGQVAMPTNPPRGNVPGFVIPDVSMNPTTNQPSN